MTATHLVQACPLCGSSEHQDAAASLPNLYSEKLAALLNREESELLATVANVQCLQCSLIYKRNWFARAMLEQLFAGSVPSHPKGWDVLSGRFTPANFADEVNAYAQAIARRQQDQINRYRRSLTSILAAIPELDGSPELPSMLAAIEQGDVDLLRAAEPLLVRVMHDPRPYSRFSGFSSSDLWTYLNTKLVPLQAYAEVGCPLWGLLPRAQQHGLHVAYLKRPEPNYWSAGCRSADAVHCSQHLSDHSNVPLLDWSDPSGPRYDAIGAFQYLDHLERPASFMEALFQRARSAVIILDSVDQAVAIQHFTGWTSSAIRWLADRFACQLHADFKGIEASGNRLYLLVQH
jgi:hypothetical protein